MCFSCDRYHVCPTTLCLLSQCIPVCLCVFASGELGRSIIAASLCLPPSQHERQHCPPPRAALGHMLRAKASARACVLSRPVQSHTLQVELNSQSDTNARGEEQGRDKRSAARPRAGRIHTKKSAVRAVGTKSGKLRTRARAGARAPRGSQVGRSSHGCWVNSGGVVRALEWSVMQAEAWYRTAGGRRLGLSGRQTPRRCLDPRGASRVRAPRRRDARCAGGGLRVQPTGQKGTGMGARMARARRGGRATPAGAHLALGRRKGGCRARPNEGVAAGGGGQGPQGAAQA